LAPDTHYGDIDTNKLNGIICLDPFENADNCEIYQPLSQECYDKDRKACIDWGVILYAMLITNICGVIFETAFAYSFELTLRPTSYLDKQEDPDYNEDELDGQHNPDMKKEPKCNIVMAKCWGEMLGIFMYVFFAFILLTGSMSTFEDGKPLTVLIELSIAIAIDQVKSIPIQFIIWVMVIRRCFKF